MVSKPAGIRTVLTNIPFHTGHDGGSPRRYFKLGRFTMGNSDGFQYSHGLEYAQQLLYPMPPVWELLAYDVKDGASCLFQELVDVPDLTLKQPWDRAPQLWHRDGGGDMSGGGVITTTFTYTVPTGRKLLIQVADAQVTRLVAGTGYSYGCWSQLVVASSAVLSAQFIGLAVGATAQHTLGGEMMLPAGSVVAGVIGSYDTGGSTRHIVRASGFLFDA